MHDDQLLTQRAGYRRAIACLEAAKATLSQAGNHLVEAGLANDATGLYATHCILATDLQLLQAKLDELREQLRTPDPQRSIRAAHRQELVHWSSDALEALLADAVNNTVARIEEAEAILTERNVLH